MFLPRSPITRPPTWRRCCLGIGAVRSLSTALPAAADPPRRRDPWRGRGASWDMATDMEPAHGRLWIYDIDGQPTVAFPRWDGILREMLPEHKRNRSSPRS